MRDYASDPPTYPDGHVCNAWCLPRTGEHCSIVYGSPDYRAEIMAYGLARVLHKHFGHRTLRRHELYPEAPPSDTIPMAHRGRRVYPGHEDAYRYWYTYPAAVEDAVRGGQGA